MGDSILRNSESIVDLFARKHVGRIKKAQAEIEDEEKELSENGIENTEETEKLDTVSDEVVEEISEELENEEDIDKDIAEDIAEDIADSLSDIAERYDLEPEILVDTLTDILTDEEAKEEIEENLEKIVEAKRIAKKIVKKRYKMTALRRGQHDESLTAFEDILITFRDLNGPIAEYISDKDPELKSLAKEYDKAYLAMDSVLNKIAKFLSQAQRIYYPLA